MVKVIKGDLEHILKQIKIAEAHSAGTPLSELVSSPLVPYGLRTVDGSFNNFQPGMERFGSSGQPMQRLMDMNLGSAGSNTRDGAAPNYNLTTGSVYDAQPRLISNLVADQTLHNPAAIAAALAVNGITGAEQLAIVRSMIPTIDVATAAAASVTASKAALASATTALNTANAAENPDPVAIAAAQQAVQTAQQNLGAANTALENADAALRALAETHGLEMDGNNVFIKNIAADLGDTASFNGFMTIFGQFFDHGLDLTTKGGSGTVYVPLQPDDPLYIPGSPTNFMVLTRATNQPGADGVLGTADDIREHTNETTPWIDLNQVYTSNASHQVFLREYAMVDGKPVATGRMLESATGGPPTWKDIKVQAETKLGIKLDDMNVHAVPAVLTDLYGEFIRDENGMPQLVGPNGVLFSGTPGATVNAMEAVSAGRAFLNDIAHTAVPGEYIVSRGQTTVYGLRTPDADGDTGNAQAAPNMFGGVSTYDNELLDRHFIVGDGRGNENIALTATHAIFHGEHNLRIDQIRQTLIADGDLAFLNEWLSTDITAQQLATYRAGLETASDKAAYIDGLNLGWDGERLFQAARFSTEMVYQHLVFEEFVRAVAPQIDPFVFSNSVEIDPLIFEEFAQVVYRFGHSMLNESVELLNFANGAVTATEQKLFDAFLNPVMFDAQGTDAHTAAGAILRGMTRQAGNEIDEFTTDALRNNLVGLPLDLATLNITRARETGVPSLNAARRQIYEQTNDTYLKPYESWADFAQAIKNPLSIVNFIAAYGTHANIVAAVTAEQKRDAAWDLVFGKSDETVEQKNDRLDFLNATGSYANALLGGLEKVDFWIGGLAEKLMAFGGMLGSTFTYVFELQIERLQNGDRFYYLSRTQGMNLLTELESDSFADVIRRNTNTEDVGLHINGAAFQTADYIIEMDQSRQYNAGLGNADPAREPDVISAVTGTDSLVIRGTNYLRFTGGEHVVLGGTNNSETIIGGEGDDTIWGEGGDDRIEGGFGVDHIHGGDGDDIITDSGTDVGEADVIKGEAGDDVINGGMGLDLIFGGEGNDVLSGGSEDKSIFGGRGDDFIRAASGGGGVVYGNEGNDWMEGQGNMNTLSGDNSELFFNSRVIGHDIMLSGENDTDFDGESGDDVMIQGIGINRSNGMAGFDWVAFKGNNYAADADMNVSIFVNQQNNILRDRYDLVEGLSGWNYDDKLTGREVVLGAYDVNGNAAQIDADAPIESFSNVLLEKNLHLIDGLAELVAHLERFDVWNPHNLREVPGEDEDAVTFEVIDPTKEKLVGVMNTADGSDILLGGGGSDTIRGMAGNDIIDGDKWLNVYIEITDASGVVIGRADGLTKPIVNNGVVQFNGATLESLLFSRTITPGQLEAKREIVDGGQEDDVDTAVYWDVRENYEVIFNADGSVTVSHIDETVGAIDPATGKNLQNEGVDRLFNIELLKFADQVMDLRNTAPTVALDGFNTVTRTFADNFDVRSATNNDGSHSFTAGWTETGDGANSVTAGNVQIDQDNSNQLRFNVNAANGATLTRALDLSGVTSASVTFNVSDNNISTGFLSGDDERLHFEYAADGVNFVTVASFNGDNGGNQTLTLPVGTGFTANGAIRFRLEGTLDNDLFGLLPERFTVDNLVITANGTQVLNPPNVNIASTFTEGQAAISIGSEPLVTDDKDTIASARVVLTNASAGDVLAFGTLPAGINGLVTAENGTITVALTGAATSAAYQAAIQAITFRNTSDNPSAAPRIIEVTVSDGLLESTPATHTVTITPVQDPTTASADSIITNIARGTQIVLPEWALLANDVDPDSTLAVTAVSGANGLTGLARANGNVTFTDPTTQTAGGSFTYTATGSNNSNATATLSYDTNGTLNGTGAGNILVDNNNANTINGGGGNDVILANGGNDTIDQTSSEGRDIIDGGAGTDTYRLTGVNGAETFRIYAVTGGQNALLAAALATTFRTTTEIVVTRTVNGVESVIAELDNVEEIIINTLNVSANDGGGLNQGNTAGDTVQVLGDFTGTSLNFSTITVEGSAGDDIVDISALSSAHRIVFRSNGGNDTIVGTLRPQDVIELPTDSDPNAYERTFDEETGQSTLSNGNGHSISYAGDFDAIIGEHDDYDDDNEDDDEDEDHDDDVDGDEDDDTEGPAPAGNGNPIAGTGLGDVLIGTSGDDLIFGMGGVDYVVAGAGRDTIRLDEGNDFADAGAGRDIVWGGEGDDDILGGDDDDMLYGEAGNDWLSGDAGNDLIDGGAGDDELFGGSGNDSFIGRANDGNDLIDGGAGTDKIDIGSITSDVEVNLGTGIGGRGYVAGSQTGNDTLYGIENVTTGSGNDTIIASNAVNIMDGGAGEDVFVFRSAAAADGDTILNFEAGDKVDLSGMLAGNSAFTLVNGAPSAGQIAVTHEVREDGEYTVVTGNTDGGQPDFRISISGNHNLNSSDFNL